MKYLVIVLGIFIGGCAGYQISHTSGTIEGTNLKTPYGPANGNLIYNSTLCIEFGGKCPVDTK